jgi:hypothetical protein
LLDRDLPLTLVDLYRPIALGQYDFPQPVRPGRLVARALWASFWIAGLAGRKPRGGSGLAVTDFVRGRLGRWLQPAFFVSWHRSQPAKKSSRRVPCPGSSIALDEEEFDVEDTRANEFCSVAFHGKLSTANFADRKRSPAGRTSIGRRGRAGSPKAIGRGAINAIVSHQLLEWLAAGR